eukprot:tig00000769_g4014.t1
MPSHLKPRAPALLDNPEVQKAIRAAEKRGEARGEARGKAIEQARLPPHSRLLRDAIDFLQRANLVAEGFFFHSAKKRGHFFKGMGCLAAVFLPDLLKSRSGSI